MNYVACSNCGRRVSEVIPDVDIVVQAYVECPECIVKSCDEGMLTLQYKQLHAAYAKNRKALEDHVRSVSVFLKEMYAIMVDPLDDRTIKVEEMCKILLAAAERDRQKINDMQEHVLLVCVQLKSLTTKFCELMVFVEPFVGDTRRRVLELARISMLDKMKNLEDEIKAYASDDKKRPETS